MKESNPLNVVIIGGVAGGASAAARLRRMDEYANITVLERGPDVSFANCGLPYYIGGEITDRTRLAVQTPQSLEAMLGIKVRTRTEAVAINRESKTVSIRCIESGEEEQLAYDRVILAPGASPVRPPLPGIDDPRIHTLRTLPDMDGIREAAFAARRVLVIGAGFIGLEMAEQLAHLNKEVTLVELLPQVLPQMDPEMTRLIEDALHDSGVNLILGDGIKSFESGEGGGSPEGSSSLWATLNSGQEIETDLVVLSIGVRPENHLAKEAGLELGERGHIAVNEYLQTSDPAIYAVGDAVETTEPVYGERTAVPLGGLANRQARIAADHIAQGEKTFPYPGSIGTAIVRVFDSVAAVTGWTEKRLAQAEKPYRSTVVTDFSHANYYPDAVPMSVKVLWDPEDNRLIGAQAVGSDGVDKRIDVLATAIAGGLTIDRISHLELAYAPPFGSAKDPANIAAFSACNIRDGLVQPLYELPVDTDAQVVDVRPQPVYDLCPTDGAVNIPLGQMRSRLGELDPNRPVITVCALGKTSYFAARILAQRGFDVAGVVGGIRVCRDYKTPTKPPASPSPQPEADGEVVHLDATGISCPGPMLNMREAVKALEPGQALEVKATDPDFLHDLSPFAKQMNLNVESYTRDRGVMTARLHKA